MKSPPDGYTVLITNDNAASAPHIMKLSHDYTKELVPVCYLGRHGQILAAHSSIGVSTVKELVEYAKANPGLGIATSGVGSNQHVLCEWLKKETGAKLRLLTFTVETRDVDVIGDEPVWYKNNVVGWVTSGGFAHFVGQSVALGYVPKEVADENEGFEIEIIGKRYKARPQREPLFDPKGERMRG